MPKYDCNSVCLNHQSVFLCLKILNQKENWKFKHKKNAYCLQEIFVVAVLMKLWKYFQQKGINFTFCMKMKSVINPINRYSFYQIIAVLFATEVFVIHGQTDFFRNGREILNRSPSARCKWMDAETLSLDKCKFKLLKWLKNLVF